MPSSPDSGQLEKWLAGDDMIDHGDSGYTGIATL
jgi:hypothetical protein